MASADTIIDPTDWLITSLPLLSSVENSLRCQVCKDFFVSPVITTCAHTFCSLCIRRCLSADGKCPACRAADQASKLRRNGALEEVVTTFQAARDEILKVATEDYNRKRQRNDVKNEDVIDGEVAERCGNRYIRPSKRRRVDTEPPNSSLPQRQTRSRARMETSTTSSQDIVTIVNDDDDDDYIDENNPSSSQLAPQVDDGLVGCPMCGARMKEASVFNHLDTCDGTRREIHQTSVSSSSLPPTSTSHTLTSRVPQSKPSPLPNPSLKPPPERISELNYSLVSDSALRKKLKDLGIPNTGSKTVMVRRHTEWVNLWNANCDSTRPKGKRELLHELDVWEKSQNGIIGRGGGIDLMNSASVGGGGTNGATNGNGIMKKDFDAVAYSKSNNDEFARLIALAKQKAGKKREEEKSSTEIGIGKDDENHVDSKPGTDIQMNKVEEESIYENETNYGLDVEKSTFAQQDAMSKPQSQPQMLEVKSPMITSATLGNDGFG